MVFILNEQTNKMTQTGNPHIKMFCTTSEESLVSCILFTIK